MCPTWRVPGAPQLQIPIVTAGESKAGLPGAPQLATLRVSAGEVEVGGACSASAGERDGVPEALYSEATGLVCLGVTGEVKVGRCLGRLSKVHGLGYLWGPSAAAFDSLRCDVRTDRSPGAPSLQHLTPNSCSGAAAIVICAHPGIHKGWVLSCRMKQEHIMKD
eukprot:350163-Pelagomonas_calceolata.AAC.1